VANSVTVKLSTGADRVRDARRRAGVVFLSWSFVQGRSREIADALDGEAWSIYPARLVGRRLTPLRYAVSALLTAVKLVRRRPTAVVVTNPPIVPALLVWLYGRIVPCRLALDSHPASFGRKGDRVSARLLPVHRWLARRVDAVLVTTDEWVAEVERWGGRGVVVHEAPPPWTCGPPRPRVDGVTRVLFVGVFGGDEPVDEVVDAARRLDDVELLVTGDLRRAPAGLVEGAPPNVRFVGFLGPDEYAAAVDQADLLLALTTEPTSIMRAAYEGVYAGRPVIVSDWPALRELFPYAVFVANEADGIAEGVRTAIDDRGTLLAGLAPARELQTTRWDDQRAEVRSILVSDVRDR
jgi:glycosyltransferase involved in cell wall biosynthesis